MAALETQVRELAERVRQSEQDAAVVRVLAGGADRDVEQIRGEIRDLRQATISSFNAMREDVTDLRTPINDGFVQVDRGFAEMRGRLDVTAAGLDQITSLLNTLISRQDDRWTVMIGTGRHTPAQLPGLGLPRQHSPALARRSMQPIKSTKPATDAARPRRTSTQ